MRKIAMLGTGLIGTFYTMSLHGLRNRDRVVHVYSRTAQRAKKFAEDFKIPKWTTDVKVAINDPEVDVVVVGLPNNIHKDVIFAAADAGKAILCTKPLARHAEEAWEILKYVEKAGVFHGYLEDLVYTPKHLKARSSVQKGAIGKVLWVRSREAHPGPHSDWFWKPEISGGGVLLDMGCHCIEIGRNFIGKDIRPVEVVCWADTQVHPIESEDHAIGLIKYANGAIGQFETAWSFRGGMELKDEVSGTDGSIKMDNFLRTGFEMFSAPGKSGYISEKVETQTGWIFPVGDEVHELGYNFMFADMLDAIDNGTRPGEDFYDGYVVNEIMDACYRSVKSKKWETVNLKEWKGKDKVEPLTAFREYDEKYWLVKEELLTDKRKKVILKDKSTGDIIQKEI